MRSPNRPSGGGQGSSEQPGGIVRRAAGYLSEVHSCANSGATIDNGFSI